MRIKTQKSILCILEKIKESIYILDQENNNSKVLQSDCLEAIECIDMHMKKELSSRAYAWYGTRIEEVYRIMASDRNAVEQDWVQKLLKLLKEIHLHLLEENEVKYLIYFLPYKFSMWDSMESVWCAAKEDVRCEVKIMPIPYYTKNENAVFEKMIYEGEKFLEKESIVDYRENILQEIRPDIVYIHNPYDQDNNVTSVLPEYYSKRLKQCTNELVYIPYYIAGQYNNIENAEKLLTLSAMRNVDRIILQSNTLKNILRGDKQLYDKAVVLGNPKIDAVRDYKKSHIYEWEKNIENRKVILITTTLEVLLACVDPMDWIKSLDVILGEILQNKNLFFIWRPHPLTEDTIQSMRPSCLCKYLELKEKLSECTNLKIDNEAKLMDVYDMSDALISDGGSTLLQYVFTKKPVLSIYNVDKMKYCACDYSKVYMAFNLYASMFEEEIDFKQLEASERLNAYAKGTELFCKWVINDNDIDKKVRLEAIENSVENANENCGEKIHAYILNEVIQNEGVMVM